MVLVGNLKDLKLANIIQINCIERNVAKVTVSSLEKVGYIYFSNGQIVHAEFHPYIGERAVQEMLGLTDGQFKAESDVEAPAHTISRPWNSVVLEGLRLIDEKHLQATPIPKQLFAYLSDQKGVKNVYVLDYHGKVIEGRSSDKRLPLTVSFIWYKFKKSLTLFYADSFNYIYVRYSNRYLFIFESAPHLVVIETDLHIIISGFVNRVQKILKSVTTK